VTFKNAEALREVARARAARARADRDRQPLPGAGAAPRQALNEPAFVVHVAAELARLWDEPLEAVARRTTHNTQALFGLSAS
jgi:TatD DNase family protein